MSNDSGHIKLTDAQGNLTLEALLAYRDGHLNEDDRQRVGDLLQDDPMAQEALEGLEGVPSENATAAVEELNRNISAQAAGGHSNSLWHNQWLRVAAVAVVVVAVTSVVVLTLDPGNNNTNIAQNTAETEKRPGTGSKNAPAPMDSSDAPRKENSEDESISFADEDKDAVGGGLKKALEQEEKYKAEDTPADERPLADKQEMAAEEEPTTADITVTPEQPAPAEAVEEAEVAQLDDMQEEELQPESPAMMNTKLSDEERMASGIGSTGNQPEADAAPGADVGALDAKVSESQTVGGTAKTTTEQDSIELGAIATGSKSNRSSGKQQQLKAPAAAQGDAGNNGYFASEGQPSFPGGEDALEQYLEDNLHYPEEMNESSIVGIVYVQFVVTKKGKIKEVEVIRGIHPAYDAEAKRVVENMPDWEPATVNGQKADQQMVLPVRFKMK